LINYFKSYSSSSDDRFFVSPCTTRDDLRTIVQNKILLPRMGNVALFEHRIQNSWLG